MGWMGLVPLDDAAESPAQDVRVLVLGEPSPTPHAEGREGDRQPATGASRGRASADDAGEPAMSRHVLVVAVDTAYTERFPDLPPVHTWRLECPDGNGCSGFVECDEPHGADGMDAVDGPWDAVEDAPWDGCDEYDFHGQTHTWYDGHGWTVPYPGCVVQGAGCDAPDALGEPDPAGGRRLPLGRWAVEDEWDDTECILLLVGPEQALSPNPPIPHTWPI